MPDDAFADLDLDRTARRGYPEAVYCEGKTPEQVAAIAAAVRARPDVVTLFTRAGPAHAKAVLSELPDASVAPLRVSRHYYCWSCAPLFTGICS